MRPFSGHLVQYPPRYPTSKVTQTLNRRFRPTSCPDLLPLPGAIIRLTSIRSHGTGPQWSSGLAWQARKAGWQAGRGPYTAGLGVHRVKAHSKNGPNQLQETQNPLLSAGDNKVDDDCKSCVAVWAWTPLVLNRHRTIHGTWRTCACLFLGQSCIPPAYRVISLPL